MVFGSSTALIIVIHTFFVMKLTNTCLSVCPPHSLAVEETLVFGSTTALVVVIHTFYVCPPYSLAVEETLVSGSAWHGGVCFSG